MTIERQTADEREELPGESAIELEVKKWATIFKDLLKAPLDSNKTMSDFNHFLREANKTLPVPKHPTIRFYQICRRKNLEMKSKREQQDNTPQRCNKAAIEGRREKYQYELAQLKYYNCGKKVVQSIMNEDSPKQCPINMEKIEEKNVFLILAMKFKSTQICWALKQIM